MPMFEMYCGNPSCEEYQKKDTYLVENLRKMPECMGCGQKLEKMISSFSAKTDSKTGSNAGGQQAGPIFLTILQFTQNKPKENRTRKYQPIFN